MNIFMRETPQQMRRLREQRAVREAYQRRMVQDFMDAKEVFDATIMRDPTKSAAERETAWQAFTAQWHETLLTVGA